MSLSELFAAIFSLFRQSGASPAPAPAPVEPLSVGGDIVPAVPVTANAAPVTAPVAPVTAARAPAPVPVDPEAWLPLARPLVQHFEQCRLVAYWDRNGKVWTCGWGTTGADVGEGTVWTQAQADARLDAGLRAAAAIVDHAVRVPLTPQQKAALVSIVYNVGAGRAAHGDDPGRDGIVTLANGQPSTLLRHLNISDYPGCADQFPSWNKSGGVVLGGLVLRRAAERDLFLTGTWKA